MSFPNVVWCPGSGKELYHSCQREPRRARKVRCPSCGRRLKTKRDVGDGSYSFYECYALRMPRHKPKK